MKRFITASDVEFLSLTGQRTLRIDEEDIVTSVAQEMAAKLGVTITQETSSPTHGNPRAYPEFLEEPRGRLFASERLGEIVLKDGNDRMARARIIQREHPYLPRKDFGDLSFERFGPWRITGDRYYWKVCLAGDH